MGDTEHFDKYIAGISDKASRKETSEYGYRKDFEILLEEIFASINVKRIDHDPKAKGGNKPDFIVIKDEVPLLYIEVKPLGVSLDKVEKSDQMARYYGYTNLVLTDYVEFRFYRNGVSYGDPIKLAEYDSQNKKVTPTPDNYEYLAKTLIDFTQSYKEPIRSGSHLAKIMGGKAQRIRDNMRHFFSEESNEDDELFKVYSTIKKLLIHDLEKDDFADMYAQTLVYGLFVARYHDESPDTFTRQEARDLVPKSNPFLHDFFDHIAGPNFNKKLEYIVDELCEVFTHADVPKLMDDYYKNNSNGGSSKGPDPVIHFYEDFLEEYDSKLRKKMGAFYTPLHVVQFIVRSVDYLLKKEFKLKDGLADTTKLENGVHKVQVLDPAVGTGTFISAVIGEIYKKLLRSKQMGRWPTYVHHELLPRIHGFEIMMAPYTIAHLKLSMAFEKTGFKYFNKRLGIYLTNSLDDVEEQQKDMFAFGLAESIAKESKQAAKVKSETPIMVVLGNPPYSVSSQNKGKWITNLIKVYKKGLNEKKLNLDDDYIKFIRFAEHFIEKNGTGIVAMITNNSFIDGITHRQMRKHLLETFDNIYVLDLHGSTKKRETAPDGGKDDNVFDIQQGVSISIFVRKSKDKGDLGTIYHSDLFGRREEKFKYLNSNDVSKIRWKELKNRKPYYFFVPKDFGLKKEYMRNLVLTDLFINYGNGIGTDRDSLFYDSNGEELKDRMITLFSGNYDERFKSQYSVRDSSSYKLSEKITNNVYKDNCITKALYRPFDRRFLYYDQSITSRSAYKVMQHMIKDGNLSLLVTRQLSTTKYRHVFVTDVICDRDPLSVATRERTQVFPLYLYSDDGSKTPNLKQEIVDKIKETVGNVTPKEIFDYIYAILYCPTYRERYEEFLKIDFPRVPYPTNRELFKKLVKLGSQLRELHLMESPKLEKYITTYPESGSNTVEKIQYKDSKVYISKVQHFGKVPEVAWNFYIGGYQPAQKWLKDRKGRQLTNEEIEHYQKIIVALVEMDKLMKKIDEVVPKWPME